MSFMIKKVMNQIGNIVPGLFFYGVHTNRTHPDQYYQFL